MSTASPIEPWLTPAATHRCAPPAGSSMSLDPSVRELAPGVLVGGYPFRLLRLEPHGRALVARWAAGEPLGASPSDLRLAARLADAAIFHPRPVKGGPNPTEVTFVIPVKDRPAELGRLLDVLGSRRVIVVDDASEDPAAISSVVHAAGAQLIELPGSRGPGGARNAGMLGVESEITCFLDSDVMLDDVGLLDQLLVHFADPAVAVVSPRVVGPPGDKLLERFEMAASPLDVGRSPAVVRPGSSVSYVPSAALLVRSSLGPSLFDERLAGGEDVDLIWRLTSKGHTVRFDPGVIVFHPARATLHAWLSQRFFYGTTAASLEARHGELVAPMAGSGWTAAALGALVGGAPVAAIGSIGVGAAMLSKRLEGRVTSPRRTAARLVASNAVSAGPQLARQVLRSWSPVLLLSSLVSRRARRALAMILAVSTLERRRSSRRQLSVAEAAVLGSIDDVAYAAGLWTGVLRTRRTGALRPRFVWRSRRSSPGPPGSDT